MRLFLTVVGGADGTQKEVDFRLVKDDRALRIGLDIVLHLAQQITSTASLHTKP